MNCPEPLSLGSLSRLLRALLHLHSTLAPFRADIQALAGTAAEEMPPSLLTMWRLCQERVDRLLDVAPPEASMAGHIRLMAQEMADNLIDEQHDLAALAELAEALEQTCEAWLLEVEETLHAALSGLEE